MCPAYLLRTISHVPMQSAIRDLSKQGWKNDFKNSSNPSSPPSPPPLVDADSPIGGILPDDGVFTCVGWQVTQCIPYGK